MRIEAQMLDLHEASKLHAGATYLKDGLSAAADFSGPGSFEIPDFEREITDVIRRRSPSFMRLAGLGCMVHATGHPHRYVEQLAIATATATDPRAITPTPSGAQRVERAAFIKATVAQTNFSHFDVEVNAQQGKFANLEAKDIEDIANAIVVKNGQMLWKGSDTSMLTPTTNEWVGGLQQIVTGGNITNIAKGASIIDTIKTVVSAMLASETFNAIPTAIYCNPLAANYIDQEAKASQIRMNEVEFVAGVKVSGIMTQAGVLPMPSDPFLSELTTAQLSALGLSSLSSMGATHCYPIVISTEEMIEMPYVNPNGDWKPRVFQLGLLSGLQGQFVGINYMAAVFKGASYAHALVLVYV